MRNKYLFLLLCFLFITYAVLLIGKASFVVKDIRYFVLFDDEMVSMRYAKNLAHGFGLVWNPGGERVEGITNPLWTAYMSLLHFLPIPIEKIGLVIQLSGIFFTLLTLFVVNKLCRFLSAPTFATVLALILTAFYFPLTNWNVILGTEVSLLTFLICWQTLLALKTLQTKRFSPFLFFLLGLGTLIRLDAAIPALAIIIYLLIFVKKNQKRILFYGVPVFLSFLFLQEGLGIWYYHELLPNTYYLKATGFPVFLRITRGFFVSLQMVNPLLIAQAAIFVLLKKNRSLNLIALIILSQVAYSIYVGGDAWEFFGGTNRYVTTVIPLFFILLSLSLSKIILYLQKEFSIRRNGLLVLKIAMVTLFLLILNTNNADEFVQWTTLKESYAMGQNRYQVDIANSINSLSTPDAKVAITLAGVTPYFSGNRYFIDLLGKNDKHIARMDIDMSQIPQNKLKRFIIYNPGHMKSDFAYSLTTYNPDIIIQPLADKNNSLLTKNYRQVRLNNEYDFFLKKGSQHILWENMAKENSGYKLSN